MREQESIAIRNKNGSLADFSIESGEACTPSDTDIFQDKVQLFVGTGGDIKVDMANRGTSLLFKNIPNGSYLPIWVKKVYATDTTAEDIIKIF